MIYETNNRAIKLESNSIDKWYIQVSFEFVKNIVDEKHMIFIDYKIDGKDSSEIINVDNSYCRIFKITSQSKGWF